MLGNRNIQDTTVKLWDYLYKVRIPYLLSRDPDDIKRFGTRISGVKEVDESRHGDWFTTMLNVSTMIDYYKNFVPIKVVYEKDVKEIYDSISNHIHHWKLRLQNGINIGDAPIDDLITMDKFANVIYEHAKYQFTEDIAESFMIQSLNSVTKVNASNFFNPKVMSDLQNNSSVDGVTRINHSDEDTLPERESLGDFFKTRLINLRR